MKYSYTPQGVCSRTIMFDINDEGVLRNVRFDGGCHGNTQGICALAEGRKAIEVRDCLIGIDCKGKGTSCPAQLALAIGEALDKHAQ